MCVCVPRVCMHVQASFSQYFMNPWWKLLSNLQCSQTYLKCTSVTVNQSTMDAWAGWRGAGSEKKIDFHQSYCFGKPWVNLKTSGQGFDCLPFKCVLGHFLCFCNPLNYDMDYVMFMCICHYVILLHAYARRGLVCSLIWRTLHTLPPDGNSLFQIFLGPIWPAVNFSFLVLLKHKLMGVVSTEQFFRLQTVIW